MKSLSKIIILLFTSLSLMACGGSQLSPEDQLSDPTEFSGVIQPLEINLYTEGTHQIKSEDGKVVNIESSTINLNSYLDKSVVIRGEMRTLIDNKTKVFTVKNIQLSDLADLQDWLDFEDKKIGLMFNYPPVWQLIQNKELILKSNGVNWVTIATFDRVDASLIDFIKTKEIEDGTPVTVGAQKSYRFKTEEGIKIYVPNPALRKVYLISFLVQEGSDDQEKLFYDFIETFTPLASSSNRPKGALCGGEEKLTCNQGYRCELSGAEKNATGVCVAIDSGSADNCPFVPKPSQCENYQVKSKSRNGCPLSYECLDSAEEVKVEASDSSEEGGIEASDESRVIEIFKKYQSRILLDVKTIDRFEVDVDQKLLAIEFQRAIPKRYVYRYTPSGNEFNFQKVADYSQNEKGKWVIKKGEEVEVIPSDTDHTSDSETQERSESLRYYDNPYKDFSVGYSKNWYFKSFGSIENSVWTVGFSNKEINEIGDALVELAVLDGKKTEQKKLSGDQYLVIVPRDEDSHFNVVGSALYKNEIDEIADSIENRR